MKLCRNFLRIVGPMTVGILLLLDSCVFSYWPEFTNYKLDSLSGNIQKGPFQEGSSILIKELDEFLEPTGEEYNGEVINDLGYYSIQDIHIKYPVVEVIAEGLYFNENLGVVTDSVLKLSALADISEIDQVNINILTHLESVRIKYLIKRGTDFYSAKRQAQEEVLKVFGISSFMSSYFHELDVCIDESKNAILFACSLTMQGSLSASELTELIYDVQMDIEKDGRLNDGRLIRILFDQVCQLDPDSIEDDFSVWYSINDVSWELQFFRDYINTIKMSLWSRLD